MSLLVSPDKLPLVLGCGILLVVLLGVVLPNAMPTPRGLLNRKRRELKYRRYQLRQAEKVADRARNRLQRLGRNAANVVPAKLEQAKLAAADSETMLGHARESVMVAENLLRQVIVERYPPARQPALIDRYMPDARPGN